MSVGTTVLVVDDDASLRMLCRVNLELEGYRVLEAETIQSARQVLETEQVGVVLLDVHVGSEDGRELLHELRAERPAVAVALFSGSADVDPEGVDGVIGKPFSLDELSTTVARLAAR